MTVQVSNSWWTYVVTCLQPSRLHQKVQPQFGCWLTVLGGAADACTAPPWDD